MTEAPFYNGNLIWSQHILEKSKNFVCKTCLAVYLKQHSYTKLFTSHRGWSISRWKNPFVSGLRAPLWDGIVTSAHRILDRLTDFMYKIFSVVYSQHLYTNLFILQGSWSFAAISSWTRTLAFQRTLAISLAQSYHLAKAPWREAKQSDFYQGEWRLT